MKRLILLRHAHAPRSEGESDADRKLSPMGYAEAKEVAHYIIDNDIVIDLVKSSDSIRTRQTLGKMYESFSKHPKTEFSRKLYNASGHEILEEISITPDEYHSLLIVGHNPGITSILDILNPNASTQDAINSRNYEVTCKLVIISSNCNSWVELPDSDCTIEKVFYPTAYTS